MLIVIQNACSLKLGMNVPWGILHRIDIGIFYTLKNMATDTKNRIWGSNSSFLHISPKLLGLVMLT